jgi:hypothetical protein
MITFGWSPEVTKSRIAAYDFNSVAAVRAAIEFVLCPEKQLPGQKGIRIAIQGSIINRETLSPISNVKKKPAT